MTIDQAYAEALKENDQLRAALRALVDHIKRQAEYKEKLYTHEVSMGRTWENDCGALNNYAELQTLNELLASEPLRAALKLLEET